ncbi:dethiobiotin synthase [Zhenpiania hominis]|uniref:ATP-dependent dethiobiotin synthetase BioD n=1 Tax=Zhenpiania hominis TaxID=2763644 RepID=A0A923NLR5_9FIRM|nr:dethiobiotin synthase [Zhenpiania hominis]MBC6680265.1 dethiobiotin synthase [Zhenpiania hominis]
MTKRLFITATGTDVGKTYITALLVKKMRQAGRNAGYYKAALSGAERKGGRLIPGDAAYVKRVAGLEPAAEEMVSYIYEAAVSPHLASELEGNPVELSIVTEDFHRICESFDYITVEGSGGILCPVRRNRLMMEDIIKALDCPVLIIAPAGLGTINDTILTIEYARSRKIEVTGVILNWFHKGDVMEEDNLRFIEEYTGVPVIACAEENARDLDIEPERLAALYR